MLSLRIALVDLRTESRRTRYRCVNAFIRGTTVSLRQEIRAQLPPDIDSCCDFLAIVPLGILYNGYETPSVCS